ncbi:MAG: DNA integrity scanning diadenylate cyclase DisA [Candidatus Bipolaricaulota bacterium]
MPFETLEELLEKIAPGTTLRDAIDRIVEQGHGGLLVLSSLDEIEDIITTGFQIDSEVTSQRLSELSKMDGAIVIDDSLRRITYANAHLSPDPSIESLETGTRHKAAEQTAKQLRLPVLAISERRDRVTVYFKDQRYILRDISTIMSKVNQALLIMDQYRGNYDDAVQELTALELDGNVLPFHVANPLTKIGQMLTLKEEILRMFVELGEEKALPGRQLDNMVAGIENNLEFIVKDFQKTETEETFEETREKIIDLCTDTPPSTKEIMGLLGYEEEDLDDFLVPRGYRILHQIPRLPHTVIERVVDKFGNLEEILSAEKEELQEVKGIAETRSNTIKAGLKRLEHRITLMEESET